MSLINISYEHLPFYGLLYLVLFVLFLFDLQVLPLFFDLNVLCVLSLAIIYYWTIYNPRLLPAPLLFAVGLIKDLLTGFPLTGLSSLSFIVVHLLIRPQRIYLSGQSFFMIWAGYAAIIFLILLIFWLALCLYLWRWSPVTSFTIEGCIMLFAFPLVCFVMAAVHRMMPFAGSEKNTLS